MLRKDGENFKISHENSSYAIIHVNQKATRPLRSVCLILLRISLSKYIAWRKVKKTEVPRLGNKFENTFYAKRSCQDMYEIVSFLHKSLVAEEPSIKDKMKLPMEYFDSEALIKQQEIVLFKPPSPSLPKLPSNAPPEYDFFTKSPVSFCCYSWVTSLVSMFLPGEFFPSKPTITEAHSLPYKKLNNTQVFHWNTGHFLGFHSNVWLWQIYLLYISLFCDLNSNLLINVISPTHFNRLHSKCS